MRIKGGSSVFPRIVGLLQDGKQRTVREIAEELSVTGGCVRYLIAAAYDGRMPYRVHISGYQLTKSKQAALFSLGAGKDAEPIDVFPFARN